MIHDAVLFTSGATFGATLGFLICACLAMAKRADEAEAALLPDPVEHVT